MFKQPENHALVKRKSGKKHYDFRNDRAKMSLERNLSKFRVVNVVKITQIQRSSDKEIAIFLIARRVFFR